MVAPDPVVAPERTEQSSFPKRRARQRRAATIEFDVKGGQGGDQERRLADHDRGRARCAEGATVIGPTGALRAMVATKPIDFRKGSADLAALRRAMMGADPLSGRSTCSDEFAQSRLAPIATEALQRIAEFFQVVSSRHLLW